MSISFIISQSKTVSNVCSTLYRLQLFSYVRMSQAEISHEKSNSKSQGHIQQKDGHSQASKQAMLEVTIDIKNVLLLNKNLIHLGTNYLSQSSTTNLKIMLLNHSKIGNKGCKYLTKASWNNLEYLCLNQNKFDSVGLNHLSKGKWSQLKALQVMGNHLSNDSMKMIIKGNFPKIYDLSLTNKYIKALVEPECCLTSNQVKQLFLMEQKQIKYICLNNQIDSYQEELISLNNLLKQKFSTDSIFVR